jgi:ABC-2 type transport system permease protein
MYGKVNVESAAIVIGYMLLFMALAVYGYDPGRGLIAKRGGPPE